MAFEVRPEPTIQSLEAELRDALPMRHLEGKPRPTLSWRDVIRTIIGELRTQRQIESQ
ncbi:MAG: hypothetical protein Greene07147_825 [Parcubacteria group bacterium Greene0714_7]|nr:MAG: hypothetical protein Greene07147_825 [Parcubacteria group bacterium Greene0714_7]